MADRFYDLLIEKAKIVGLFLMLTLVPIAFTTGDARIFQEKVMVIAGMSYASLFFGSIWATLFFLLSILLFIWNGCEVGSSQVINIFIGCILFMAARSLFYKRGIDILTNVFKVLVALNLVWIILQIFRVDPIFLGKNALDVVQWGVSFNMPAGLFNYQAAMGMFLCIAMPFFFISSMLLPLMLIIPICLASSANCYLAGAIMALYGIFYIQMVTFKHRIIYWIIFIVIVCGGIFGIYRDYSMDKLTSNSRYESWHMFIKSGMNYPLFGYGPDSFRNITPHKNYVFSADESYNPLILQNMPDGSQMARYHSADEGKRVERFKNKQPKTFSAWREAHNEFIQIFFEYGILGLALVGFFVYEIFLRFRLSADSKEVRVLFGSIICYLILSITQFPFHLARLSIFLPVMLGAFFAYTDDDWNMFVKGGR